MQKSHYRLLRCLEKLNLHVAIEVVLGWTTKREIVDGWQADFTELHGVVRVSRPSDPQLVTYGNFEHGIDVVFDFQQRLRRWKV